MASSAAAARKARARREIQQHFFQADAVRPDRAVAFTPDDRFERRQFHSYRDAGVIHEATLGHYWLDIPAYDVVLRGRHRRVKIALSLLIGAMLAVILLGEWGGRIH